MSWGLTGQITDSAVATKAAKDGSDFTNPSTWRTGLGVLTSGETNAIPRAALGGVCVDGFTAGAKVSHALTGTSIGTGALSLVARMSAGVSQTTFACPLILGSSATTGVAANTICIRTDGNSLAVVLFGSTTSDYNSWTWTGFNAAYPNQDVIVAVVRPSTASTNPVIYINGVDMTASGSFATAGTPPTWQGSITSSYFIIGGGTATVSFLGCIKTARIFNRSLSQQDVLDLGQQMVAKDADKWGSITAKASSDFSASLGGVATGTATVTGNVDTNADAAGVPPSNDWLRGVNTGQTSWYCYCGNGGGSLLVLTPGKRYRVSCSVFVPSGSPAQYFAVFANNASGSASNPTPLTLTPGSVQTPTFEFDSGITNNIWGFRLSNSTNTALQSLTAGAATVYIRDVVVTQIGCVLDSDLGVGVGFQAPDLSSNNFHGDISTTGITHAVEKYDSHHTIVKTLAHSDISSTAATTVLATLPPNCGVIEVEFDRGTAFDSGITVDVGISGTQAKFVSAQSLAATGKVWVDSLSKVSESGTGNTSVYIKKSGATTIGSTVVRITYRIRNK